MAHAMTDEFGGELSRWMDLRATGVRELARRAGYSPGHISDLRTGRRAPSVDVARDLDDALSAGGALQAIAVRRGGMPCESGGPGVPKDSADQPGLGLEPWQLADTLTRSSVSMTAVSFMEESVTSLAARYPFTPPAGLSPGVQVMLRAVNDALARSQPLAVRTRCVRLAGILSGIAGQIADDNGRPDTSAAWFGAALVAAQETADPDLAAWTLALRSIGCHFRGEYRLAADLLDRATATSSSSTPRRQAWLAALSARSHAAIAAESGSTVQGSAAVMRVLDDARGRLQAAGPSSDTDFFDGPRLTGMAGSALMILGDTRAAEELIAEALAARSASDVKGIALLTLDLAECAAADGDPEHAASLAGRAISMAGSDIVLPVMTRAAAVHQALQPWSGARAVLELGGQLADMRAAGTEA
jgi:hypothetical protein